MKTIPFEQLAAVVYRPLRHNVTRRQLTEFLAIVQPDLIPDSSGHYPALESWAFLAVWYQQQANYCRVAGRFADINGSGFVNAPVWTEQAAVYQEEARHFAALAGIPFDELNNHPEEKYV